MLRLKIKQKNIIAFIGIIIFSGILYGFFLVDHRHSSQRFSVSSAPSFSRVTFTAGSNNGNASKKLRLVSSEPHKASTDFDGGDNNNKAIHLMFTIFQAKQDKLFPDKLRRCLSSIFKSLVNPHVTITVHMFGDWDGFSLLGEMLGEVDTRRRVKDLLYHNLTNFPETLRQMRDINREVSQGQHLFSRPYFYATLFLHRLLPLSVSRVISLDIDLVVKSDISRLHALFDDFSESNVMAMSREGQPTYRYMFHEFRQANPGSRAGEPPPNGLTGFNSGVVLLDLDKMRRSSEYNRFLENGTLASVAKKYMFEGNLGDQDVFTLISLEHERLFHVLPCGWNRQLCRWWQMADFDQVFDKYFSCQDELHILHGNCRTKIEDGD